MALIYVFILILVLLLLFSYVYGAFSGAPWLPTKSKDVERVVKFSGINKGDKFYEMGSGDGRLSSAVVKAGAEAYGFEVAVFPYLISKIRKLFVKKRHNYNMKLGSFWNADVSEADFVYVFLIPEKNDQIAEKLKNEMKKGAKIIAYVWPFNGWEPLKVDKKEDRVNIYLYEV